MHDVSSWRRCYDLVLGTHSTDCRDGLVPGGLAFVRPSVNWPDKFEMVAATAKDAAKPEEFDVS